MKRYQTLTVKKEQLWLAAEALDKAISHLQRENETKSVTPVSGPKFESEGNGFVGYQQFLIAD